jgi:DNA-binding transcriptional ArsR family regulator
MRAMATALQVAPSTVSRALTKLASWGLIAYVVGRGRWGGLVIFRRAKDDGMERFRKAAQARVRRWSEAVRRRISRLEFNVAPYVLEGPSSYYRDYLLTTSNKGATLTAQRRWTVEELRDAGII